MNKDRLLKIILEELETVLLERCQKGYKTHPTRKTKKCMEKLIETASRQMKEMIH